MLLKKEEKGLLLVLTIIVHNPYIHTQQRMLSLAQELDLEIQNGRNGKVGIIPVQYERVSDYIEIAKNTMYVVGGETGAGKTTVTSDLFMVNPIKWYLKNKTPDMKLSIIGFFMERKRYMMTARIVSRLIFEEQGIIIHPKRILGRKKEMQLKDWQYELVREYYKVLDEWEKDDLLIMKEGSQNPKAIAKYLESFAKKYGTIHEKDKDDLLGQRKYTPNHPNHIVLVIGDNSGILAPEGEGNTKKLVDAFSRTMRESRDTYGFSPVIVQQLGRSLSDVHRQRLGDLEPTLSDFADSSQTQRDGDVVLALFNPYDHAVTEKMTHGGYDLKKLKDKWFRTYYRSLHILKNSYDSNGIYFPMALHPVFGIFKTLPRSNEIPDNIYSKVISGGYFLPNDGDGGRIAFNGFGKNRIHT